MPRFTDRYIAGLKADRRIEVKDDACKGLAIRVTPGTKRGLLGRKTWCYRYFRSGKMHRITLGEYPAMSLAQATAEANKRSVDLYDGRNPAAEAQRETLAAVVTGDELTFDKLADRFIAEYAKPRKKSWRDDEWVLGLARKKFGPRYISTLKRKDYVQYLRNMAIHSVRNANKSQASICTMYNWINIEDETIINPLARLPKLGGKEREEDRVLTDDELRVLWPALVQINMPMTQVAGIALRLIFLTGQRPLQITGMRLDELVDLDGDFPRWDLPAERMKRPKPHSVPLSEEAVRHIKWAISLRPERQQGSPYVFPSPRGEGNKAISRHALSKAVLRLRSADYLGMAEWSPHDGRRSATTWARAMGIPRDTTEALTHHAIIGSGKTYDRYDMQTEKRQAVDAIADYIRRATGVQILSDTRAA
ncbi:tyrosine-type recombinase/integrase [Tardiphaga robiniae]|uniref:Site-specific integrase n=1 Tax=Tardiphaga robiniae TaxID=943830 RepID=A0A7G6TVM1_9BRAD|nr:site-specific integrase [Tardiphaga robiniae]QND70803.1 site-specific integrase [Tardiphaga robiniae]